MQLFLDHDRGIYHFHVFVFPGNLINVQYYASNEDKISRANVNKQTRLECRLGENWTPTQRNNRDA